MQAAYSFCCVPLFFLLLHGKMRKYLLDKDRIVPVFIHTGQLIRT